MVFPWKNITLTDMAEVDTIITEMLNNDVAISFCFPSGEFYGDVTSANVVVGGIKIGMMVEGLEMIALIPNPTAIFIANNHDSAIVSQEENR